MRRAVLCLLAITPVSGVVTKACFAQQQPRFAFVRPAPGISVMHDVTYASDDTQPLKMDVYRPPRSTRSTSGRPVLVFFNRGTGADRAFPLYQRWAQAAASRGIVGVVADIRDASQISDLRALIAHLVHHAPAYGADSSAIAVYAASGNVYSALPALEDTTFHGVRAAVLYYGSGPVTQFRLDLPLLFVRAGLDRPEVNRDIVTLVSVAAAQNAPVSLLNHAGGYHGFEMFNDDDATRDVIDRTLDFVVHATSSRFQSSVASAMPEAAAAGAMATGKFGDAARAYAALLISRPEDARLRLSYGEALLGDKQFDLACTEFAKLKDRGLGFRDLGLPAARACVQKGDADAAIAWLASIPSRFLPGTVENEAVFAAIRDRAEFRALFKRE